jgi:hypothetical protein
LGDLLPRSRSISRRLSSKSSSLSLMRCSTVPFATVASASAILHVDATRSPTVQAAPAAVPLYLRVAADDVCEDAGALSQERDFRGQVAASTDGRWPQKVRR